MRTHFTNNLRQHTGSLIETEGEKVILYGTVVDQNCVPIDGAVVEIWQADSKGCNYYCHLLSEDKNKKISSTEEARNRAFTGYGRMLTGNAGYFEFSTIMPGGKGRQPPKINVQIKHSDFPKLHTVITLENVPNESIYRTKATFDGYVERNNITEAMYKINFVLNGFGKNRRY
jgi:protocatechuate 3,4-dioxygenase beta subunit